MHCNAEFYYVGKIPRTDIGRPSKQRRVVLRHRNTVVGGKRVLPSALLVFLFPCGFVVSLLPVECVSVSLRLRRTRHVGGSNSVERACSCRLGQNPHQCDQNAAKFC